MRHVRVADLEEAAEALEERTRGRLSGLMGLDPSTIKIDDIPPGRDDPEFLQDSLDWAGCEATTEEVLEFIVKTLMTGGMKAEKAAQDAIDKGEFPPIAKQYLRSVMMLNCYLTGMQIGMLAARIATEGES